jgi:hypothetical protein
MPWQALRELKDDDAAAAGTYVAPVAIRFRLAPGLVWPRWKLVASGFLRAAAEPKLRAVAHANWLLLAHRVRTAACAARRPTMDRIG